MFQRADFYQKRVKLPAKLFGLADFFVSKTFAARAAVSGAAVLVRGAGEGAGKTGGGEIGPCQARGVAYGRGNSKHHSMKPHLLAALALALPAAVLAASGPLKEKALAVASAHKDSVVFLSAVLSIEVTAGSMPAKKEEKKLELLGTVIGKDGLIVAPLSALDVSSALDGRTVNTAQGAVKISAKSEVKEVQIIMPDGSEVAAKLLLKDADLDLAFLRPEKDGAAFTPVDTANSAPPALLDDVIVLGRLGKDLNREPLVFTSEIVAIVAKPRTFAKTPGQCLGLPVFNGEGKFIGVGVNRFSSKSDTEGQASAANVIVSAADLLESAAQLK